MRVVRRGRGLLQGPRELPIWSLAERHWKGLPERVRVPYAKENQTPVAVLEYHGAR